MVGHWHGRSWRRPTLRRWLLVWRRVWRRPEAARVVVRHAYMPQRICWRGVLHSVREIERSWELQAAQPRRYFRVRCQGGQQLTLFQDLRVGSWYVCP